MLNDSWYKSKFAGSGLRVLVRAIRESQRRNQNCVSTGHIAQALAYEESDIFEEIMRGLGVNPREIVEITEQRINRCPRHLGQGVRVAAEATELFKRALARAYGKGRNSIEASDLFIALSQDEKGILHEVLKDSGVAPHLIIAIVRAHVCAREKETLHLHDLNDEPEQLPGRMVRIKSGSFASFTGKIIEIDEQRATLKVQITVFGNAKVIELKMLDVENLTFT